jgi:NAD+ kinase
MNGLECHLCEDIISLVGHGDLSYSRDDMLRSCDVVISLGGDGSMLATARLFGHHGIPILGINLGKLGFLTEVDQDQIDHALLKLKQDDFEIEERMMLATEIPRGAGKQLPALNDVVIDHGESIRLAKIDLFSDGIFVCPYDADGIVVSTPTGSTAYSMSVGGPIINPLMEAILVAPISPHTLTLRTIIFPGQSVLNIRAGPSEMKLRLAVDGQVVGDLASGEEISVRKAPYKLKLVKFDSKSFYEILRSKLHWGARPLFNQ